MQGLNSRHTGGCRKERDGGTWAMTNLEHDSRNTKKLEFVVLGGKIGLSDAQNIAVGKPAEESPDCVGQHTG